MAGNVSISKVNENDSMETRVSKINSNFQNLLQAAMLLDRTGILVKKNKKVSDSAIAKLADELLALGEDLDRLRDDMEKIHAPYEEQYDPQGWSYRKWKNGIIELWGRAAGSCLPGVETTLTASLPFDIEEVISWQASLRKTTVPDIFLERSSVDNGQFSAIIENNSSSVAIAVANAYIIGRDQKEEME